MSVGHRSLGVEGTPGVRHRIAQVEGGPLSVYVAGDEGLAPVVLLHGAMFDEARFVWDQLFPALATEFRVYAVDLPRHGASRPWAGHLDHARLIRILAAGFEQLGLSRFRVVGLSMGGGLAIEYATTFPEQVERMVLFEPGGLGDRLDHHLLTWAYLRTPGTRRLLSLVTSRKSQAKLRKTLDSLYVGGSTPTDPERLLPILKAEADGKRRFREADLDDWQTDAIGATRLTWNLLDEIPRIQCPTLWLRGADSALVKQDELEWAVRLADKADAPAALRIIPGGGHLLPLERPAEVNPVVLDYLR